MTEIRFYHLIRQSVEQALPPLTQKIYETGKRILIQTGTPAMSERISEILWTFDGGSFLPHGTAKDGSPEKQPIWITDKDENPNNATIIIRLDGAGESTLENFEICCDIFDGNDNDSLQKARSRWKDYKEAGYTLAYWQQTERGWEKKSET